MPDEDLNSELNTYREFIKYLADEAIGKTDFIIETVIESETICFCGYIEVEKIIKGKDIILKFIYNDKTFEATWQPYDNYGVYQIDEGFDCYDGFMLFPTYDNNKYFLMGFTC